jgi:hypothetical protein
MKPAVSTTVSSSQFVSRLFSDPEFVKEAAEGISLFIQDKIREKGFARKVVDPTYISPKDLVPTEHTDQPAIMVERDVDARAMTVPLRGRGEFRYHETDRYTVYFQKVVSEKIRKSKMEMMTVKTDYKKLFRDRIYEAMYEVEDLTVMGGVSKVLKDEEAAFRSANGGNLATQGNKEFSSQTVYFKNGETLDKSNLVFLFQMPTRNRIANKIVLLTETLIQELMHMTMQEVGDSVVSKFWEDGVDNISDFWNKKIVTTIKSHIIKNNEIYTFAPREMYGHFFILQDHTSYMEVDRDMMTMDSEAYIAHAIGNTKGVYKGVFTDIEE